MQGKHLTDADVHCDTPTTVFLSLRTFVSPIRNAKERKRGRERGRGRKRERGRDLRLFSLVTLEAKRNQRTQWKVRKRETWLKLGKMERNLTSE